MKRSLKQPIPELFESWDLMTAAADAHLSGDAEAAEALFRGANMPVLWDWLYPHWEKCHLNVIDKSPLGDSTTIAKADRHSKRFLDGSEKAAILTRDGYRCRYCGIPVISPEVRKAVRALYPRAVPWDANDPRERHMGLQALWLQFDHVVPHSHGGRSDLENSVVSCALCNFGKDKYTLRQLGLEDPRLRDPVLTEWDGLERLLAGKMVMLRLPSPVPKKPSIELQSAPAIKRERPATFFLAGARISEGYLYTLPILGKERWFQLGPEVQAEAVKRAGETGCLLTCSAVHLLRRGLTPKEVRALTVSAAGPEDASQ
jgi:5-methylcytosine-specific restriction endonuclease McrA